MTLYLQKNHAAYDAAWAMAHGQYTKQKKLKTIFVPHRENIK